ncbi:12282_t:CDS:2 [Rhizophagus irregularis]|nr:12282_t:CDS:2 [Rhizophagus irregularis]
MVAQMWEKEPPEVKQYWDQVAEQSDITFVNATASSSQSATKKK